jgi:hypothetical protein
MAGQQHTCEQLGHKTSTTWRAASQSLTSCRTRRDPDACVGVGERNQSRQVRGAHASWPASNTHVSSEGSITSTTWRAASQSLTSCRIRQDPDACVGFGKRKQSRQFREAHASMAGQQHTCEQRGHITSTTWRATWESLTSCNCRRDPDPRAGLGERKQSGQAREAQANMGSQQHTCEQRGHITSTTWQEASQSLTACRIRWDPDAFVGLAHLPPLSAGRGGRHAHDF